MYYKISLIEYISGFVNLIRIQYCNDKKITKSLILVSAVNESFAMINKIIKIINKCIVTENETDLIEILFFSYKISPLLSKDTVEFIIGIIFLNIIKADAISMVKFNFVELMGAG